MAAKKVKKKTRERLVEAEVEFPSKNIGSVKMTKVRVKQCAYCKHYYINPCDDKAAPKCPNYLFLQQKQIPRGKKGGKTK